MSLVGYDGQIELEEEDWDDEDDFEDDEEDEWECEFGERCLVSSFTHRRSECYTVEMAQAWRDEERRTA